MVFEAVPVTIDLGSMSDPNIVLRQYEQGAVGSLFTWSIVTCCNVISAQCQGISQGKALNLISLLHMTSDLSPTSSVFRQEVFKNTFPVLFSKLTESKECQSGLHSCYILVVFCGCADTKFICVVLVFMKMPSHRNLLFT